VAGINLRGGGGAGASLNTVNSVPNTTGAAPAAVVAYGPGGTSVGNAGPGIVNSSAGSLAIYIGAGALVLLAMARRSHANKRDFDQDILTIVLTVVALTGIRIDARRRVQEGKTAGITGALSQAAAVM
jgi:hypothetical protein